VVEQLSGWLRLRSVADVPERDPDLIRSANWLVGTLRETGFPIVEVWRSEGGPAVYAEWCAAMSGVCAHLVATGRAAPEMNLKFLVEGEECR
jgi:hypothetical protein